MRSRSTTIIIALSFIAVCVLSAGPSVAGRYHSHADNISGDKRPSKPDLNALASRSGDLGDYFRLKLAEKKLTAGDNDAAMKLAQRVHSKALTFWKSVVSAEILLADSQPQKAIDELKKLPPRPAPELSFEETFYADLYKRALLVLREAKLSLGRSADNESAELAANFPTDSDACGYSSDLDVEGRTVKLHVLVFDQKYSLIGTLITPQEIIGSRLSRERKCQALFDLGYGLRNNHDMASDAAAAFEGVSDQKCEHNLRARALYWIGMLGDNIQNDDMVDRALKKLAYEFKGHRLQDDAFYMLYKRALRRNQAELMKKYLGELMDLPRGDMRDKLAFETAFPYYMKRDYARAAEILEPLVNTHSPEEGLTKVLYWYARSLERSGVKDKATKIYRRIVSDYPYSFYASLAAARANVPLNIPALPKLKGEKPKNDEGMFDLIDKLNAQGFRNEAGEVMDLAINLHPEWEKSYEEYVTLKFIESQNYRKALDMAALHFDSGVYGPVTPQSDPMFSAFYPMAFAEAVDGGYRLTGLPRGAIEGIMREESLFQVGVRSSAGAVGLMQLMPRTAAIMARGNAGGADASNLTEPADNVLLGSSYLADMLGRFGGQMPLAIMAYNAGPGNVAKFMRKLGGLDLDEFIENIPISETRGYVKRVMRSMKVYGSIYNEGELSDPYSSFQVSLKVR